MIRKNGIVKIFLGAMAFLLLHANTARATVYECNTTQVLHWKKGRFVPDNDRFSRKHEVLRIDDKNSKAWFALDRDSPFGPLPINI